MAKKKNEIEQAVRDRVISILKRHDRGIELPDLMNLYKTIHGKKLAYTGKFAKALKNLDGVQVEGDRTWFGAAPAGQIIDLPEKLLRCEVCSIKSFKSEAKYRKHLCSQSHVDRVASLASAGWVSPVDFASHRHHGGPDGRLEDDMLPDITFTVIESVDGMSNTQTINSAELSSVTFYTCPEEEEPDQNSGNEINESQTKQVRKNPDCAPVDEIEMQDADGACNSEQPDASEEFDHMSKTPQQQGTKAVVESVNRMPRTPKGILQQECRAIEERLLRSSGGEFKEVVVHQDTDSLLDILPAEWGESLEEIGLDGISDVSLDIGRRPYCWHSKRRYYLSNDKEYLVEHDDLREIILNLQEFGDDNRAGLDGQLHRISAIRDNQELIIGLTIRVGRHVEGNAALIRDLLADDRSILLLGEPGSGKTTIVRDIAKELSDQANVFIVDTSNEIAGDGGVPHPCVGMSRRMMVPSLRDQASVMVECLQNHTPEVMVIDEIGRGREVEAAQTSKNRGVRMIASAHGDLRSLMKNRELRGLIGGLATTTVGDMEARRMQKKAGGEILQKQVTQRAAAPIFETIIELRRGRLNEWHIIPDVATAVDTVLKGKTYDVQKRIRCNESQRYLVDYIHG